MLTDLIAAADFGVPSTAAKVEPVVSATGIKAYLIHEPSIPFLSLALYFTGGGATDPRGREGLAFMTAGLLDEGAGPHDSQAFRSELEDNAIRLSFDADRDGFSGELKTLSEKREHAFELLRLAVTAPRFDPEPVERIRSQILADLRRRETDPDYLAARTWFAAAFPGHPYAHPTRGYPETVRAITAEDCRRFVASRLARDNLVVGVAGDITAEELRVLLDATFGDLPAESRRPEVPKVQPRVGSTEVVRMAIPQSVVTFGHGGIERKDPDYYAAYVANYILGGGGFSSRLIEEVREKRGLAYSVYSYLYDLDAAPLWIGGVATNNQQVRQSIELVRQELARMAKGDIGETDLRNAKTYLTGSFPLRLTSNDQIAKTLVGMLIDDLGQDYLERRNDYIAAVTLEDVCRVSRRLFSGELLVSVVGDPEGL
ncbi:M16 family metallopeptidase [Benzoatithermus flavus]|uniref:Pitrilysin family protein n=1 Tax=Benzoatithermus flavus TaxID=3108223 RepID=A0ABU8XUY9_9PROT